MKITRTEAYTHYKFDSTEARDRYLAEHFPGRRALGTPGTYRMPDGSTLGVVLTDVWHSPPVPRGDEDEDEAEEDA
jgi:hypothetical protein